MQKGTRLIASIAIGITLATGWLVAEQTYAAGPNAAAAATNAGSKLSDGLYKGFRATRLLGSNVFSVKGEYLGEVRNAILSRDGQIQYAIVEGGTATSGPEFMFRVPWNRLTLPLHPGALVANLSDAGAREFGLFLDTEGGERKNLDFQVSRLIGDYARLQAGQGYGYVSDLVFSPAGKAIAVLVARDKQAGGGTVAFAYPDSMTKWNPSMSYYGLPYITAQQANEAGMTVDMQAFADART